MFRVPRSKPVIQGTLSGDLLCLEMAHCTKDRRDVHQSLTYEEAVELRDDLSQLIDELGDRLDQRDRERSAA